MAAIETDKMEAKVKEFLDKAKPGQMFNFCEDESVDGTRSITVYEVQNQEWMTECAHCGRQQYPTRWPSRDAVKCRACGKQLTSSERGQSG